MTRDQVLQAAIHYWILKEEQAKRQEELQRSIWDHMSELESRPRSGEFRGEDEGAGPGTHPGTREIDI